MIILRVLLMELRSHMRYACPDHTSTQITQSLPRSHLNLKYHNNIPGKGKNKYAQNTIPQKSRVGGDSLAP